MMLFVVAVVFAVISAIGFISTNRVELTGTQVSKNAGLALAERRAGEIHLRVSGYPKIKPSAAIAAEIEKHKTNHRWDTSKGCTDATAKLSRRLCSQIADLKSSLATARTVERDRALLASTRKRIETLRGEGAGTETDPQAALLARLLSYVVPKTTKADASFWLMIGFAGVMEVFASLGLFVAISLWPPRRKKTASYVSTMPRAELGALRYREPPALASASAPLATGHPAIDFEHVRRLAKPDDLELTAEEISAMRDAWKESA